MWPFLLAGLLAPGASQILFTLAVHEVGASRTSVTVGAAPLVAVAIALVFLGEPVSAPLVIGALAIVGGGVLLAAERDRPEHLAPVGLLYARGGGRRCSPRATTSSVRCTRRRRPETAAAATLLAGAIVAALWTRRAPTRRELARLAPAGVLFGLSYLCLFEAYFRGRVTVVSPLVATESLWGVALLGAPDPPVTEDIGRRLAGSAPPSSSPAAS